MSQVSKETRSAASVWVVDSEIVSRHVAADPLRPCEYLIVCAADANETHTALGEPSFLVDVAGFATEGASCSVNCCKWLRVA